MSLSAMEEIIQISLYASLQDGQEEGRQSTDTEPILMA
jgi:hypothetical protein